MKTSTAPRTTTPRSKPNTSKKKTAVAALEAQNSTPGIEVPAIESVHSFAHHEVARLAQGIYEEEGRPEGRAEAHWFEAERRLREGDRHHRSQIRPYAGR